MLFFILLFLVALLGVTLRFGFPNPFFCFLNRRFELFDARLFIIVSFLPQRHVFSMQCIELTITFLEFIHKILLPDAGRSGIRSFANHSLGWLVLLNGPLEVQFGTNLTFNFFHLALDFVLECGI